MKSRTLISVLAIATSIIALPTPTYAGTSRYYEDPDAWCSGTVTGSLSGTSTHRTKATTCNRGASRAEYKRRPQNSGSQSMGGRMKINGGNYISLIQVLNYLSGSKGSSKPVAQLAAKRDGKIGGVNAYRFYVVQGGKGNICKGMSRLKKGQYRSVKVTYEKGKKPVFKVGNQICDYDESKTNGNAGTLADGTSGRYYYGKLGAYNTSGEQNNSSVTWKDKYD